MGFAGRLSVVAVAAVWVGCGGGSEPAGMTGSATSGLTTTGLPPATQGSSEGGSGTGSTSGVDPSTTTSTSAVETDSTMGSTGPGSSSSSTGGGG